MPQRLKEAEEEEYSDDEDDGIDTCDSDGLCMDDSFSFTGLPETEEQGYGSPLAIVRRGHQIVITGHSSVEHFS